jgi:2-beta-glucuronyltransferase
VTFATVAFSRLSHLKADHRLEEGAHLRANRVERIDPQFDSYVWFTPFHPLNRLPRALQLLAWPIFAAYGRLPAPGFRAAIEGADLIVFESTAGLMLVDRVRAWNPVARLAYRVSDDLRLLRAHPVVLNAEARSSPRFAVISVPNSSMLRLFDGHPGVRVDMHGLEASAFDCATESPYAPESMNAVFVGMSHLDTNFLEHAAALFPKWTFHVIGRLGHVPRRPNVVEHGELPFHETVPYIVHADIGLATRSYALGAESLASSLKVIQYTYARLPIVAPDFMRSERKNVFTYRPGDDESIRRALLAAEAMDRSMIDRSDIPSWLDLARALAGPGPAR